jgi:tetratricopeptide (TPR) repeat protein
MHAARMPFHRVVTGGLGIVWFVVGPFSLQTAKISAGALTLSLPQSTNRKQADALIGDAGKKFAQGNFKENVRLLKEAATLDPTNPRVWWKLCEGYQLTEELDSAVEACEQEIKINPTAISYNGLGLVYLAKKDYRHAAEYFGRAAKDSKVPQIHSNLVWALLGSEQYEKAVPAAQRMIEVSDESSEMQQALEMLATAYQKLGQIPKAHEALDKLHKLVPTINYQSCEMKNDSDGKLILDCR